MEADDTVGIEEAFDSLDDDTEEIPDERKKEARPKKKENKPGSTIDVTM